jgi:methionine-rich copper-binding protein CopC
MSRILRISFLRLLLATSVLVLQAQPMQAHAILLDSRPAANSKVSGPNISIQLRFNVRIDLARSRLILVQPDGAQKRLHLNEYMSADVVASNAEGLKPGAYRLRWQVLASDGHITRGEVLFTVVSA